MWDEILVIVFPYDLNQKVKRNAHLVKVSNDLVIQSRYGPDVTFAPYKAYLFVSRDR